MRWNGWRRWLRSPAQTQRAAAPRRRGYRCALEALEGRALLDGSGFSDTLVTQHADLDIGFAGGTWDLGVRDRTGSRDLAADTTLLQVSGAARRVRPADSAYNFLGVAENGPVWVLPQDQAAQVLFLGVSAEGIASGALASYREADPRVNADGAYVKLTLKSMLGAGQFSVYSTDTAGTPTVWMSTPDGIAPTDAVFLTAGGHTHYNWAFSAPGTYDLVFQASAFANDGSQTPISSGEVTYHFEVEGGPGRLQFGAATLNVTETAGTATLTVTRAGGSDGTVTAQYTVSDGTATAGSDYAAPSGLLTFGPGETSKTIAIAIAQDTRVEATETLSVTLGPILGGADGGTPLTAAVSIENVLATPNQRYVAALYPEVLGRAADLTGLSFWPPRLDQGLVSREQVIQFLQASDEYLGLKVDRLYQQLLRRAPDALASAGGIAFLRAGGSEALLRTILVSSAEYFQTRGGGTSAGWLDAAYNDLLGRPVDAGGLAFFTAQLTAGTPRESVVAALVGSDEFRRRLVQTAYQDVLNRAADAGGLDHWAEQLRQGLPYDVLLTVLVASNEYFTTHSAAP